MFIHDEQGLERSQHIAVRGGDGIFNSRIIAIYLKVNGHRCLPWLRLLGKSIPGHPVPRFCILSTVCKPSKSCVGVTLRLSRMLGVEGAS
jgi:hypothetical protein